MAKKAKKAIKAKKSKKPAKAKKGARAKKARKVSKSPRRTYASSEEVSFHQCEVGSAEIAAVRPRKMAFGKPATAGLTSPNIDWRVCKALEHMRAQINVMAPNRNKGSDGGIGDMAHWKKGDASDHNPWVSEGANKGVVTARDFTHHVAGGCDCNVLVASLISAKDSRIKYIIWNEVIYNSAPVHGKAAWEGRAYTGANKHNKHAHVSVKSAKASYDSTADWNIKVS